MLIALAVACAPPARENADRAPVPVVDAQPPAPPTDSADSAPTAAPLAHTALIASYETRYAVGSPRGHNIERAASLLYFVPIEPGDVFSFNQQVGPRDHAHGFQKAPVIVDGELTDGDGGGVCQVSSTLHAAARLACLTIEERTPHTRSSDYIAPGLDATVAYPSKDLKIRNDGSSPVILALATHPDPAHKWAGILTAEVLGEAPDASVPTYSFTTGSTGQPSGAHTKAGCPSKLAQKGVGGRIVWSTLTAGDGSKTTWRSVYPPTDEVWQVCP